MLGTFGSVRRLSRCSIFTFWTISKYQLKRRVLRSPELNPRPFACGMKSACKVDGKLQNYFKITSKLSSRKLAHDQVGPTKTTKACPLIIVCGTLTV